MRSTFFASSLYVNDSSLCFCHKCSLQQGTYVWGTLKFLYLILRYFELACVEPILGLPRVSMFDLILYEFSWQGLHWALGLFKTNSWGRYEPQESKITPSGQKNKWPASKIPSIFLWTWSSTNIIFTSTLGLDWMWGQLKSKLNLVRKIPWIKVIGICRGSGRYRYFQCTVIGIGTLNGPW